MIEFFSCIQNALNYIPKCLICRHDINGLESLTPSPISSLRIDYDNYGYGGFYPKITYTLVENGYDDIYEINVRTSELERTVKIRAEKCVVGSFAGATQYSHMTPSTPPTRGSQYLYLGVACRNCRKYDYTLQLIVDLEKQEMKHIVFNSERCVFQKHEMGERRELRNVYTTKRTIYSYFAAATPGTIVNELKQDLPLLTLNREDPNKTLERVKNLLIFT